MTILIAGGREDAEVSRVIKELRARKEAFTLLDTAAFPERSRFSWRNGSLFQGSREQQVPRVVYLRGLVCHPLLPVFQRELLERSRGLLAQCEEKGAFLKSVLLTFEQAGVVFINSLAANRQHSHKPWQLHLLQKAGLTIPRWIASNDPVAVRAFTDEVGACVYKPLAGGATVRMLEKDDLKAKRLSALRLAPVLFQEYVEGVPVRVYVVGRRIIAAAEIQTG